MQTVNVTMKAGALKGIVDLPNFDDEQLVNVTVSPDVNENKKITEQDFEDLLAEIKNFWAASGMDGIVTRNMKGFKDSDIKIFTPEEILDFVKAQEEKN